MSSGALSRCDIYGAGGRKVVFYVCTGGAHPTREEVRTWAQRRAREETDEAARRRKPEKKAHHRDEAAVYTALAERNHTRCAACKGRVVVLTMSAVFGGSRTEIVSHEGGPKDHEPAIDLSPADVDEPPPGR